MLPKDSILLTPTSNKNYHPNASQLHQYAHRSSPMSKLLSNTHAQYDTAVVEHPAFPSRIAGMSTASASHSTSAHVIKDRTTLQTNTIAIWSIYLHRRIGMSKATPIDENPALHHGFASKKHGVFPVSSKTTQETSCPLPSISVVIHRHTNAI